MSAAAFFACFHSLIKCLEFLILGGLISLWSSSETITRWSSFVSKRKHPSMEIEGVVRYFVLKFDLISTLLTFKWRAQGQWRVEKESSTFDAVSSESCGASLAFSPFCIQWSVYVDANNNELYWIRSWPSMELQGFVGCFLLILTWPKFYSRRVEELNNRGVEKGWAHLKLSETSSTCRACLTFSHFCIEGYAYIDANKNKLYWIRSWPRQRNGHKSTKFWGGWAIKRRVWKRAAKVGRSVPCLLNQKLPLCKLRSVTANIIHSYPKILSEYHNRWMHDRKHQQLKKE